MILPDIALKMELQHQDQRALARMLADRLPGYAERSRVAGAAGVASSAQLTGDPEAVWTSIVERSSTSGTVPELLRAAARARPGDARLRRAAHGAAEGQLVLGGGVAPYVAVAVAGLLIGVGGWWVLRGDTEGDAVAGVAVPEQSEQSEPKLQQQSAAQPADEQPAAEVVAGEADGDALAAAAVRRDEGARSEPVAKPRRVERERATPADRVDETAAIAAPAGLATSDGRCAAEPGEVVGYWYTTLALGAGDVHTLTHGVNVRTDYPRQENGWSSRASIACVLKPGDRVRIAAAPIEVGSGYRWVPLRSGDLTPR